MSKYREDIRTSLFAVKKQLVGTCKRCKSTGYVIEQDVLVDCECMRIFKYVSRLIIAEIPREYWFLSYKTLQIDQVYKKIIGFFCKNINNAIEQSLGVLFLGDNGVGKTAMMCEIGKFFITRGHTVSYFTMEDYVGSWKPNGKRKDFDAAVLLIDELGKSYSKDGSTYLIDTVENFIRKSVTQRVVIASSNLDTETLTEQLGESTISVLQRHLKFVEVEGTDYSDALSDSWKNRLQQQLSLYHPNIQKMAILREKYAE